MFLQIVGRKVRVDNSRVGFGCGSVEERGSEGDLPSKQDPLGRGAVGGTKWGWGQLLLH